MSGLPAPLPAAVRVLVAEPAPLLREGLAHLLDRPPEVEVAARAGTREEALHLATRLAPDVLLLDADFLRDGAPDTPIPVVALVEERDAEALRRSVVAFEDEEVAGVVSKQDDVAVLFEAIHRVALEGAAGLSPRLKAVLLRATDVAEDDGLTPRQRALLWHLASGRTAEQVAAELHIAPGTLRNHLSAIYNRLGVKTRAEAVAWAWRAGLVGSDAEGAAHKASPERNDGRHATS